MTTPEDPATHPDQDPNGKGDPSGFQEDFLRDAAEAAAAGFPPAGDPVELPDDEKGGVWT